MIGMLRMVYEDRYLDYYEFQSLPMYDLYSENDVKTFYEKNKHQITNDVFDAIRFMMKENLLEIPVFKLNIGGQLARISVVRDKIDTLLQECIKNYEETEDYEKCALALTLINDQIENNNTVE